MSWLKTGEKHQLRITHWPSEIPPPDRKFNFRDLTASQLQLITDPFEDNFNHPLAGALEIDIVRWTECKRCLKQFSPHTLTALLACYSGEIHQ
jgi:hypothetical protein